jgi:hypothetical protein
MTPGVGAHTPYSICPSPKKAMSSSPQKKRKQTIGIKKMIRNVARKFYV